MRQLLRSKHLQHESYRYTSWHKRRRKRPYRAHPRLFRGCPRGRAAKFGAVFPVPQRRVSSVWASLRQRLKNHVTAFCDFWGAIFSWCSSARVKQRVPRHGIFTAWNTLCASDEGTDGPLFVLSAPNGLLQPLRQLPKPLQPHEFPVIWDTGASRSVSPSKADFEDGIRPSTTPSLTGLAEGLAVMGEGEVKWTVLADNGRPFVWQHTAYYVPGSPCRLLSCQSFAEYTYNVFGHAYEFILRTYDPKNKSMVIRPSTEQSFLGSQLDLPTVTCMLDEHTNFPLSMASSDVLFRPKACAQLCVTDEQNQNLTIAQKELLRWHFRLGHLNFKAIQMLLRGKTLGDSNLKVAAGRCAIPKCASCQYGKQKRRPTGATKQAPVPDREGSLKSGDLHPGQRVSVDHFYATHKGRLYESFGKSKADKMYMGGCIFVDHASGHVHVEHEVGPMRFEAVLACKSEEPCHVCGHRRQVRIA